MLDQRRTRCNNIEPTVSRCLVFAGLQSGLHYITKDFVTKIINTSFSIFDGIRRIGPLSIEYTSRCILFWARIISGPVSKLSVKM